MKFIELTIPTFSIEKQKNFYRDQLEFDLINEMPHQFSVQLKETLLTFQKSDKKYVYHYCILIPAYKTRQALDWLKPKCTLIKNEDGNFISKIDDWNAESIYFYDGDDNIAELIAHHNLQNETTTAFNKEQLLSISEMGLASVDIRTLAIQLENTLKTSVWKGNLTRFAAQGTEEGKFILVNNTIKKTWYPTQLFPEVSPFTCLVSHNKKHFKLCYTNGNLSIQNTNSNDQNNE